MKREMGDKLLKGLAGITADALKALDGEGKAPTAEALAVVATQATTPTRITGVGFIREKESDRLGDLATELTKLGADVTVETDGLTIAPTDLLHGALLDTHHDHRLAMAFGLLGLVVDGVEIADPDVVGKSWPAYWDALDAIPARRA